MKWLLISLSIFFAFPALADDQGKAALKPLKDTAANPKIVIVNGKKFYSLQGARRFTSGSNNPSALMVVHHPRSPETIISHRATLAGAGGGGGESAPATPAAPSTTQPSDILSVFAPDEKGAAAPPAPGIPTK